jgi:hypothetical protein
MKAMKELMEGLKLAVSEEKTKVCIMPKDSFIFLGISLRNWFPSGSGRSTSTPLLRKNRRRNCGSDSRPNIQEI